MGNLWIWSKAVGVATGGAIVFYTNFAIAQTTIIPDGTLSTNSVVTTQGNITTIEGGTAVGSNLFHSFKDFSVLPGATAEFINTEGVENIISRVTGKSFSNIEGIIKAQHKANLFLINPNGIIFGSNASLNIGGSFVASTASSVNFADGSKFSATDPQTVPLLKVSVPIGLEFGATAEPIRNQSQAPSRDNTTNILRRPVGLQVQPGKTLALIGGDITLEGGNLTAVSGRIELGSVTANSLVSVNQTNQDLSFGYENVQNFQNIRLIGRVANGSEIPSQVDASNVSGRGGSIQVQAKGLELTGNGVSLISQTRGNEDGESIKITTRKLIVQDGAQVTTTTARNKGAGGNLIIDASDSVELIGSLRSPNTLTGFFTVSAGEGKAGNITITTGKLRIKDGARLTAESSGTVQNSQVISGEGKGGNITVRALESVEISGKPIPNRPSILSASTLNFGNAGIVDISTGQLIVRDGGEITVSVRVAGNAISQGDTSNPGTPGALNITARYILLDEGSLTSNNKSGLGGNISLEVRDLLLMRRNSQISTNAEGNGDGGNIRINAPNGFIVAPFFGNSDITANAISGSGGKITITTKNIFGFVRRTGAEVERLDPTGEKDPNNLRTNDITAFSQENSSLDGTVEINSPDVDPSKGLVELPANLVDPSQQIAAGCGSGAKTARSSFNNIGRGGTTPDPTQPLMADAVLADWITLNPESENRANGMNNRVVVEKQQNTKSQKVNSVNEPSEIVEAQGWVTDANGNVVLVAQVPTATPHNSSLTAASCAAN
ncbi:MULTISPECIES: filamentous hemagglutinin N-terminal domain-containing protein [Nostoc]|uniref:Filamentous hemagglutinin N-terminal domain-containing protein n=1 Tax=Nostoc paludosum FACHB-159 TaxID=2692908 RepID=A0ABR8KB64_9NOSO|nr:MULTISPECIES: filamentous hemagglutinin N-terminal domain-containing protein [Nostoc]MBD2680384.1 filamentous hemagglutinin N-terminal domain-containing protein [Nostoc sp. FACHB-857]MBD2736772.1 filamentous hemagglutinin N-terminal domain-containing protein [Nostoc paludosum FACHB-159]